MALEIRIDERQCIGSGRCCAIAPAVFRLADDTAVVIDANGDSELNIVYAAMQCPTMAITVLKDGTKVE